MKCSICGINESDFEIIIKDASSKLKNNLESTSAHETILDTDALNRNKDHLRSIDADLKKITIDAFFANRDYFIKQEPHLMILGNFTVVPNNKRGQTLALGDLIESFCSEIDLEIENSRKQSQFQKQQIEGIIEMLDSQKIHFYQKSIDLDFGSNKEFEEKVVNQLDFLSKNGASRQADVYSRDAERKYKSRHLHFSNFSRTSEYYRLVGSEMLSESLKKYCPEEYKKIAVVTLCPICKSLFDEAASGAFNTIQQQYDD
jgi:hypothetical protein